jgi:hypothetical protein
MPVQAAGWDGTELEVLELEQLGVTEQTEVTETTGVPEVMERMPEVTECQSGGSPGLTKLVPPHTFQARYMPCHA